MVHEWIVNRNGMHVIIPASQLVIWDDYFSTQLCGYHNIFYIYALLIFYGFFRIFFNLHDYSKSLSNFFTVDNKFKQKINLNLFYYFWTSYI